MERGDDMEPHDLRLHLAIALKEPEIRRACCAVEAIFRAGTILDELSPAVLEQVRDYCTDWNKGRKGSFSEFKHAWIDMVTDHLNNQRLQERRLYHGITGASTDATLAKHELPSTAAALATHATDTKG
jgi:phytoene/squalene synthetase